MLYKILLSITFLAYFIHAQNTKPIAIIASGETHAMLDSCDCTDSPAGGFPKRSQLIKDIRDKKEVVLLDAGGFAAGGIYDFYIEGRRRDSIRTLLAIKAMAAMGYDAAALGDEELQYGAAWLVKNAKESQLPVVSANCRYTSGKYVTDAYRIVKKGTVAFGITAITTPEKLFPQDTSVIIEDPVKSIRNIWSELVKKSDIQIIISHLGEELTLHLADSFPDCEIFVNGHRKMSLQPVFAEENLVIMQFGFQGKTLSTIDIDQQKKAGLMTTAAWLEVERDIWDDLNMSSIISRTIYDSVPKTTQMDLYLMSKCPYGIPALGDMLQIVEKFPKTVLNVWFIGDVNIDGSLRSLHGYQEVEEEKVWLAVQSLYPHMLNSFLYLCSTEGAPAPFAINELDLDTAQIFAWVEKNGEKELAYHYKRSSRLSVDASPSLFINNYLSEYDISYIPLAKSLCREFPEVKDSAACSSMPECIKDFDCRKKGKIGACRITNPKKGGTCIYTDDVSFDFIVVLPDTILVHVENSTIKTTQELFPGSEIHIYPMSSAEGKKIIGKYKPVYLPLYLFDKKIKKAANFAKIENGLISAGNKHFTFKEGVMKKHYFLNRTLSDTLALYIDPLFMDIKNALHTVLEAFPDLKRITIKPILYDFQDSPQLAPEERRRQEESLRWLVLSKYYDAKVFAGYLKSFINHSDSSCWFFALKDAAVNADDFSKKTNEHSALLKELIQEIKALEINGPVELLNNNRELILVRNQLYFEKIIKELKNND